MENVIIVGTSHVAKESIEKVRKLIEDNKPDIVAVELDHKRAHALFHQGKTSLSPRLISRVGLQGYLFLVFGKWVQQKIGKLTGVVPGADMREAVVVAKKHNIPVALIDQDIEITLRRLSKTFSLKEKVRFVKDLFLGLLGKGKARGLSEKFALSRLPSQQLIDAVMRYMENCYPSVYSVLVADRNQVMAANIQKIAKEDKKIIVVVGAGHEKGLRALLDAKPSYKVTIGSI